MAVEDRSRLCCLAREGLLTGQERAALAAGHARERWQRVAGLDLAAVLAEGWRSCSRPGRCAPVAFARGRVRPMDW